MSKEILYSLNNNIKNTVDSFDLMNQQLESFFSFEGEKVNRDTLIQLNLLQEQMNRFMSIVSSKRKKNQEEFLGESNGTCIELPRDQINS